MANLKYNEETKIVSFRIPISKIPEVKKELYRLLESFNQKPSVKQEKECGCYLDANGFLRRGGKSCKKSKQEHNF